MPFAEEIERLRDKRGNERVTFADMEDEHHHHEEVRGLGSDASV